MFITFWYKGARAIIRVEAVMKRFSKSTRFLLWDNSTITIKRSDIISIEPID